VDLPELLVSDAAEWRTWLRDQHATSRGVWLVRATQGTTNPTALRFELESDIWESDEEVDAFLADLRTPRRASVA
jgi:hypothetical protein